MSLMSRVALCFCACAFGAASAHAAEPFTYECDTAAGAFSELAQPQSADAFTISGEVKAEKLRTDQEWWPMATILVDLGGHKGPRLQLIAPNGHAKSVNVSIGESTENAQLIGSIPLNTAVPFRLTVDQSRIRVEAGGRSVDFKRPPNSHPVASLTCSTGEFLFDRLLIQ